MRYRLEMTLPDDAEPGDALEAIAAEAARGRTEGDHLGGDGAGSWRLRELGETLEVDRRQRLAAATLLMAIDLPQEMGKMAATMMEAAEICPGMHTGELPDMGPHGRRDALRAAIRLAETMLAEIDAARA